MCSIHLDDDIPYFVIYARFKSFSDLKMYCVLTWNGVDERRRRTFGDYDGSR